MSLYTRARHTLGIGRVKQWPTKTTTKTISTYLYRLAPQQWPMKKHQAKPYLHSCTGLRHTFGKTCTAPSPVVIVRALRRLAVRSLAPGSPAVGLAVSAIGRQEHTRQTLGRVNHSSTYVLPGELTCNFGLHNTVQTTTDVTAIVRTNLLH